MGHVSAALELIEQIERGECARPRRVFVPLGSGGTAAGLWLGFGIARADIDIVAVRVVPRVVGRAGHVRHLVNGARALLRRHTGRAIPMPEARRLHIEHAFFGGAYGRPLAPSASIAPLAVDDTYSAKALRAAMAEPDESLLWLTFDGRLLQD
jgi:D-cysteine desulfhydrase